MGKKKCTFFEAPFEPSDDRCGAALSRAVGAAPPSESPVSGAGRGLKLTKIEIIKDLKSLKSLCFFTSKNMCNKSRIYDIFSVTWLMWPSRQATSCPLRGSFGYRGHVTQAPWATLQSQSWHFQSTPVAIFVREKVQLLVLCWGFMVGCWCWFFNLL